MFRWLLHKRELLTTVDAKRYGEVKDSLAAAGIPYRTRWKHTTSSGRGRRALGAFGENPAYGIQYYIYVLDQDLERARYALR